MINHQRDLLALDKFEFLEWAGTWGKCCCCWEILAIVAGNDTSARCSKCIEHGIEAVVFIPERIRNRYYVAWSHEHLCKSKT